jgi:excisionase family DNA binding protein
MENNNVSENASKPQWYSIKEAAEYLDVGEPTLYRWMREKRITYRKIGDSTRFLQEDLDGVVQVFRSDREVGRAREVCPVCNLGELVEGHLQSTGLCYFRPKQAKFWTLKDANVGTLARMCARCGHILIMGDVEKLAALRQEGTSHTTEGEPPAAEKAQ